MAETLPIGTEKQDSNNHLQPGNVFANEPAHQTVTNKLEKFPEGSIIVREKPGKASEELPELLAVMIKHRAGFNPDGGDWEFLLIDGSGTKIRLRQKQGQCLDCHRSQRDNDFVYPLK